MIRQLNYQTISAFRIKNSCITSTGWHIADVTVMERVLSYFKVVENSYMREWWNILTSGRTFQNSNTLRTSLRKQTLLMLAFFCLNTEHNWAATISSTTSSTMLSTGKGEFYYTLIECEPYFRDIIPQTYSVKIMLLAVAHYAFFKHVNDNHKNSSKK